jgi:hypothetical protein
VLGAVERHDTAQAVDLQRSDGEAIVFDGFGNGAKCELPDNDTNDCAQRGLRIRVARDRDHATRRVFGVI